ncbi:MAG: PAS domain S-box protein [Planctomycetes bacterium]|nr:PAS domain S-box protein [Planctomycetota bacterium]
MPIEDAALNAGQQLEQLRLENEALQRRCGALQYQNDELHVQLEESQDALRAIQSGDVDALIVAGEGGEQVFSLAGSDAVYRLIVETMAEAACTTTVDGTILFCNVQFGQLIGTPAEQIVGRPLRDFVAPDHLAATEALLADTQTQPVRQRLVLRNSSGDWVPVHVAANLLEQPGARSLCIVVSDLTELENSTELIQQLRSQREALRESERALRESESRLKATLRSTADEIWIVDTQGRIVSLSDSVGENLGVSPDRWADVDAALDQLQIRRLDGTAQPKADAVLPRALRGEVIRSEGEIVRNLATGQPRWREVSAAPIRGAGGRIIGAVAVVRDITDRKRAEQALQKAKDELEDRVHERTEDLLRTVDVLQSEVVRREQAEAVLRQRGEQLQTMATQLTLAEQRERRRLAEVLHDNLQQLLAGAKFRLGILTRKAEGQVRHDAGEVLELLDESIECSRTLTGELSPPILHQGGLAPALAWLAEWMRRKHNLDVRLQADENAEPQVEGVKVLLFQSARELLFNTVKHAKVDKAQLCLRRVDGQIELTVSDEGVGFDAAAAVPQDGTQGGFGLFSVRERLTLLGGGLDIDSAPGRGSRFTMRVPESLPDVEDEQSPAAVAKATASAAARRAGTAGAVTRIMLVDDHAVMREGLAMMVREEDDMEIVAEASDGRMAVDLVRQLQLDVVLMDVSMPGMDGIEATRVIHAEHPEICVIGLSMFEENDIAARMKEAGASDFLTKSGPSDLLLAAIRSCREPEDKVESPG